MKTIKLIGDPLTDVYKYYTRHPIHSKRLILDYEETFPGAALNVFENLYELMDHREDIEIDPEEMNIFIQEGSNHLIRHIVDDIVLFETYEGDLGTPAITYGSIPKRVLCRNENPETILVISDYNKGTVNRAPWETPSAQYIIPKFKSVIIDSRYGTVWPGFTEMTDCAILHATDSEIDKHPAGRYNYILHTSGKYPVTVRKVHPGCTDWRTTSVIAQLEVPDTPVVDTTGAGDTFTASIACSLIDVEQITDKAVISACTLAIKHCQDVIQKFGTAVPNR